MREKYLSRYFKFLGIFLVFCFSVDSSLAMVISEIQFDPAGADTDREWVEIFNDTNTSIDLTAYKFFQGNTNHGISVVSGDKNISSGEYVVLVEDLNKFKIDFPNFTGKIFKASFSLNNTGELIALKDANGNTVNSLTYSQTQTGAGNGLTINLQTDGSYAKGSATPGSGNLVVGAISLPIGDGQGGAGTSTASTTQSTATDTVSTYSPPTYYYRSYWPEENKVYIYAGENKIGLSGGDIIFSANAQTGNKTKISDSQTNYFWSFGDGSEGQGRIAHHAYKFPGEYVVNVQAYANGNMGEDKIYVEIFDPNIKISLQNIKDQPVVQITNNSSNEIDLGNYLLETAGGDFNKIFTLPKRLTLMPKKNILLSQDSIAFATTTNFVSLDYPNGKKISEFQLARPAATTSKEREFRTVSANASTTGLLGVFTKDEFEKVKNVVVATKTIALVSSVPPYKGGKRDFVASATKTKLPRPLASLESTHSKEGESGQQTTFQISHQKNLVEKAFAFFGI